MRVAYLVHGSPHPVERSQRHVRRNRDGCSARRCRGCFRGLRIVARSGEDALRALLLEGDAPDIDIGTGAIALVAHVGKLLAELATSSSVRSRTGAGA